MKHNVAAVHVPRSILEGLHKSLHQQLAFLRHLFIRLSDVILNERSFKILSKKGSYNNQYEVQHLPAIMTDSRPEWQHSSLQRSPMAALAQ
jgi:hypothetical protein